MSGAVCNKLLLYADDSSILVADKCLSNIETVLQNELEIVSEWLVDNKLSLHLGKTESILFGSRHRLKAQSVLSITCKGTVIEAKNTVKYLGVVLEQCLSGANMATSVIQKANASLKFLYRKRKFFKFDNQCHFDYACSFWYPGLSKVLKNKLQVTQNKIIRFVLNMDSRANVGSEVFKSLGLLPVSKRVDQIILNHVFKFKFGQSPDNMVEHFIPASSIHSYGTRFR